MRNLFIAILVIAAVGVYIYDATLLIGPSSDKTETKSKKEKDAPEVSIENLIAGVRPIKFIENKRNPFKPRVDEVVPVSAASKAVQPALSQAGTPQAPNIKINGIMGDQVAPLVMLTLPNGQSAAAKPGDSLGEYFLKKVEKDRILIICQKKSFWITR